jgi:hypothetical protein
VAHGQIGSTQSIRGQHPLKPGNAALNGFTRRELCSGMNASASPGPGSCRSKLAGGGVDGWVTTASSRRTLHPHLICEGTLPTSDTSEVCFPGGWKAWLQVDAILRLVRAANASHWRALPPTSSPQPPHFIAPLIRPAFPRPSRPLAQPDSHISHCIVKEPSKNGSRPTDMCRQSKVLWFEGRGPPLVAVQRQETWIRIVGTQAHPPGCSSELRASTTSHIS